jgi:hypothetical protein
MSTLRPPRIQLQYHHDPVVGVNQARKRHTRRPRPLFKTSDESK